MIEVETDVVIQRAVDDLRSLSEATGLSRRDVGALLGTSGQLVQDWLSGRASPTRLDVFFRLSRLIQILQAMTEEDRTMLKKSYARRQRWVQGYCPELAE